MYIQNMLNRQHKGKYGHLIYIKKIKGPHRLQSFSGKCGRCKVISNCREMFKFQRWKSVFFFFDDLTVSKGTKCGRRDKLSTNRLKFVHFSLKGKSFILSLTGFKDSAWMIMNFTERVQALKIPDTEIV